MIGETIGNFEVIARLGKGGMGEVWLAEQLVVRTRVAIKLLAADISDDRDQVDRFFNQALAAGRIKHPGVGQIFDVGFTADNRAFLVMEYLEGETLRRRLRSGALSPGRAAAFGEQIASVLAATHAAGVIHRDLKPENIILVRDPTVKCGERARLVDFGIAKLVDISQTASSGETMGTAAYMPPEQWRDVSKVDARSDTYALGCVVFEMASGRPPFVATSIGEACTKHLTNEPPLLRSLAQVPESLEQLVAQMLAKDPALRPAMIEVERSLAGLAESTPVSLAPPDDGSPAPTNVVTQATHPPSAAQVGPANVTQGTQAPASPATRTTDAATRSTLATQPTEAAISTTPSRSRLAIVAVLGAIAIVAVIAIAKSGGGTSTPDARLADAMVVLPGDATRTAPAPLDAPDGSIHTMEKTGYDRDEREFLTGNARPKRISGDLPRITTHVGMRVCWVSKTGVVERVGVDNDTRRHHPELEPIVREAVLGWRFAPYQTNLRLTCRAFDLYPDREPR